jgi:hypothetical protein
MKIFTYFFVQLILITAPAWAQTPEPGLDPVQVQARLEECQRRWNSLSSGYFRIGKDQACRDYANVSASADQLSCAAESLGNRASNRDYYINFQSMVELCRDNPEIPPEHHACNRQQLARNRQIIEAYNRCDPPIKSCLEQLNRQHATRGRKAIDQFYYEVCFSYHDQMTFGTCAAELVHRHTGLLKEHKTIEGLCHPRAVDCATHLRASLETRETASILSTIGGLCRRMTGLENIQAKASCAFRLRQQYGLSEGVSVNLCTQDSPAGPLPIDCMGEMLEKKVHHEQALTICRMANVTMRSCLIDFALKRGEFTSSLLQELGLAGAQLYCALESTSQKSCVQQKLRDNSQRDEASIQNYFRTCRTDSSNYQQCLRDFEEYFGVGYGLNVSRVDGEKICAHGMEQMRVCMYNAIIRREYVRPANVFSHAKTFFPYEEYEGRCLAEVTGATLLNLSSGTEWSCRFQYFYRMELWDKAWHCATAPGERLCQEYNQELRAMDNDALRPHCQRFNPSYHTAERAYGNPLWHLCAERGLR